MAEKVPNRRNIPNAAMRLPELDLEWVSGHFIGYQLFNWLVFGLALPCAADKLNGEGIALANGMGGGYGAWLGANPLDFLLWMR
jgi:hypothetical protein